MHKPLERLNSESGQYVIFGYMPSDSTSYVLSKGTKKEILIEWDSNGEDWKSTFDMVLVNTAEGFSKVATKQEMH